MTDSVQQCLCGFVSTHQYELQVHVAFDQEAFGHQADPHHSTQHDATAGLSVLKEKLKDRITPQFSHIAFFYKTHYCHLYFPV